MCILLAQRPVWLGLTLNCSLTQNLLTTFSTIFEKSSSEIHHLATLLRVKRFNFTIFSLLAKFKVYKQLWKALTFLIISDISVVQIYLLVTSSPFCQIFLKIIAQSWTDQNWFPFMYFFKPRFLVITFFILFFKALFW